MCDMYGHGFWWKENERYVVMMDYEINSHSSIKSKRPQLIPAGAQSCGFDPVDGKPVGKNGEELPIEVQEKIHFIMETDFPTRNSIAQWIRQNYAKNNDKENWDYRLLLMLADKGMGIFSKQNYTQQVQYYKQWAQNCTRWAQNYTQQAQDYTQRAQDYTQRAQDYTQQAQYYTHQAQNCTRWAQNCTQQVQYYKQGAQNYTQQAQYYTHQAQNCTGELDEMNLDKFLEYFENNPNEYWAKRDNIKPCEKKQYALV